MRARRPLPASARTILLYLSFLSDEGRVHEGSLNPYLAAVNQMHEDSGLEKPGTTHFVRLARKGFDQFHVAVEEGLDFVAVQTDDRVLRARQLHVKAS